MFSEEKVSKGLRRLARWLSFKDCTQKEVTQKLEKVFCEKVTEEVVKRAKLKGWLKNDRQFSEEFIKRGHEKGRGYLWICRQLEEKGLSGFKENGSLERKKALKLLTKKAFKTSLQKVRFLSYRGFSQHVIEDVVEHEELTD